MEKLKNILKNLVYPITLLTVITFLSILITIEALYIAFTNDHTAAIYAAISIPITIVLVFLYLIDRWLIKRISYFKLMLGEIVIGSMLFLYFSYQNSYTTINFGSDEDSYTDVNFHTNEDYILVIFDSKIDSLKKFNKKGLFGEEMNVYYVNKIHLDKSLALRKDLRINTPKDWMRTVYIQDKYYFEGDSIEYIYIFKEKEGEDLKANYIRQTDVYIDSLLRREMY